MTRGTLAKRIDALEEKEAQRREEVEEVNHANLERALTRLSPADRAAEQDGLAVIGGQDPDYLARLRHACAWIVPPTPEDPAEKEAEEWAQNWADVPEGAYFVAPPADRVGAFVVYFERMATISEEEARRVPFSPDVQRAARWSAALWRLHARLCEVLAA